MISEAIQGVVTVSIVAITVFILKLVVWVCRKISADLTLLQAKEIRTAVDGFTSKVVMIDRRKNSDKINIESCKGMLADAIRESGLDPQDYYLEGLILAKDYEISNGKISKETPS